MTTKYRKLRKGETVQAGDGICHLLTGEEAVSILDHKSRWVGRRISTNAKTHLIDINGEVACFVRACKPEDPVIARAKRAALKARAKTTLGQLEKLVAERAQWQRRQTIAINKLAEVQREITALATRLANEKFDAELTS